MRRVKKAVHLKGPLQPPDIDPIQNPRNDSDHSNNYRFLAEALFRLFSPWVEVVVHSLDENKILYISGVNRVRRAGDSSLLSKADRLLPPGVYGPYFHANSSGRALKSISVVFQEENKKRVMICVNLDISQFQWIQSVMGSLTSVSSDSSSDSSSETSEKIGKKSSIGKTRSLGKASRAEKAPLLVDFFDENRQDKINRFVADWVGQKGLVLEQLGKKEKQELILQLQKHGAFQTKNAAAYIARTLDISRASVYGYLKRGGHEG